MLRKITEAITNFFSHRKRFKDTKVYNYRYYFIMILVTIFSVSGMCYIRTGGDSDSQTTTTTTSIKWNYGTTAS